MLSNVEVSQNRGALPRGHIRFGEVEAAAQQAEKIPAIGFLSPVPINTSERQAVLRGLRERGHVEGPNIIVVQRDKAAELVRLKVDVIVVFGTSAVGLPRKRPRQFRS